MSKVLSFEEVCKLEAGTYVKRISAKEDHDWWYEVSKPGDLGILYQIGQCSSDQPDFGPRGKDGHVSPEDFGGWKWVVFGASA